jgi:hypothetical protein
MTLKLYLKAGFCIKKKKDLYRERDLAQITKTVIIKLQLKCL